MQYCIGLFVNSISCQTMEGRLAAPHTNMPNCPGLRRVLPRTDNKMLEEASLFCSVMRQTTVQVYRAATNSCLAKQSWVDRLIAR